LGSNGALSVVGEWVGVDLVDELSIDARLASLVLWQSVASEKRLERRGNLRREERFGSNSSDRSHTRGGDGRS
jgi:hypothetical protein